jgi:hypothetical protein
MSIFDSEEDRTKFYEGTNKFIESCITFSNDMIECDKRDIKRCIEEIKRYKDWLKDLPERKSYLMQWIKNNEDSIIKYQQSLKEQKKNLAKWQAEYDRQCWKMAALNFNGKLKVVRGGLYENA